MRSEESVKPLKYLKHCRVGKLTLPSLLPWETAHAKNVSLLSEDLYLVLTLDNALLCNDIETCQ